ERVVREPERRRGVGAAAAEAGGDRNPLLDRYVPAGPDACSGGERAERARDERVVGEAGHSERVRRLDRDRVGEVDPLQEGRDLVLPVRAERSNDEREVDLRRSGRGRHASSTARSTNCPGRNASARTDGGRPSPSSATAASARDATPASSSEFGSVF